MENEIKRSHCEKIVNIDGIDTVVPKKKFDTLDEAIIACKSVNVNSEITEKVVPYKCSICCKYHIGRNGKPITDKYRGKLLGELKDKKVVKTINRLNQTNFKIVGKIDLSKIPKK